MKFLSLLALTLMASVNAFAFESTSQMGAANPMLEIRNQLDALQSRLEDMETTLSDAATCGDAGQQYTGTACITVPEVDPMLKLHGSKAMVAPCSGADSSQYYNTATNTWRCKTLSTPPPPAPAPPPPPPPPPPAWTPPPAPTGPFSWSTETAGCMNSGSRAEVPWPNTGDVCTSFGDSIYRQDPPGGCGVTKGTYHRRICH